MSRARLLQALNKGSLKGSFWPDGECLVYADGWDLAEVELKRPCRKRQHACSFNIRACCLNAVELLYLIGADMNWLKKLFGKMDEGNSPDVVNALNSRMTEIRQAGSIGGDHYTGSVEKVKQLKREGKHREAIDILLKAVSATEAESKFVGGDWGVAPWYYEQLAIIYRKEKQYHEEVEILERYAAQSKAPGEKPDKLAQRLVKAKAILAKSKA